MTTLGRHILLKKVDRFVVMEDRWHDNAIFTVLSPHTWQKLCVTVCKIADRHQTPDTRTKLVRKLSYAMTLVVITSADNTTTAFLKTHNHPMGTRFDANAWRKLINICRKSRQHFVTCQRREGHDKYDEHQGHDKRDEHESAQSEHLSDLSARLDNIQM